MGIKSAKKSNTDKTHSNGNYTIGGFLFPSYDLYDVLEMINKYLSFLYTETGEEYDYEPIFDSPTRYSDDFDEKMIILCIIFLFLKKFIKMMIE